MQNGDCVRRVVGKTETVQIGQRFGGDAADVILIIVAVPSNPGCEDLQIQYAQENGKKGEPHDACAEELSISFWGRCGTTLLEAIDFHGTEGKHDRCQNPACGKGMLNASRANCSDQ